jgi:hypothetical protein
MSRLIGGSVHRFYSVTVFIVLASLDNVTISLVPPLYTPIARTLGVAEGLVSLVTAVTFFVAPRSPSSSPRPPPSAGRTSVTVPTASRCS